MQLKIWKKLKIFTGVSGRKRVMSPCNKSDQTEDR